VLVFVAIDTEVLPIGAVRRIISEVPVFMMNREKMSVPEFKLPPAFGADKTMDLQGLLPVIRGSRGAALL
jgi:hypothetical protein